MTLPGFYTVNIVERKTTRRIQIHKSQEKGYSIFFASRRIDLK